jgi:hypothetical protein
MLDIILIKSTDIYKLILNLSDSNSGIVLHRTQMGAIAGPSEMLFIYELCI